MNHANWSAPAAAFSSRPRANERRPFHDYRLGSSVHPWKRNRLGKPLRSQLKKLAIRELEMRDRKGYEAIPEDSAGAESWAAEAVWPEE